jgi:hypothetical protein
MVLIANFVRSQAASQSGVRYLVGFEIEFILLKKTDDGSIQPVNYHPWSATRGLLDGSPETACLEAIVETLQKCDIRVEMYHAEAAPGQVRLIIYWALLQLIRCSMRSSPGLWLLSKQPTPWSSRGRLY